MGAPSNPGWKFGYTPTAGEWNNTFGGKADYPVPLDQGGTGGQSSAAGNYNLQQRAMIATPTLTAKPLTLYAIRTDMSACTITLPLATSCLPGDWIDLVDCGNNAGVNDITINAAGADNIYLYNSFAASQQIAVNGGGAILICTGSAWRMWSLTAPAPLASTLTGNEVWNVYKDGVVESVTAAEMATYAGIASKYVQWATWFNSTPQTSEILAMWSPTASFTFAGNFAGSQANPPAVNPAATFVADINHIVSGVSTVIGNVTVSVGGVVTLTTIGGGAYTISAGDLLTMTGPATADSAIKALAISFRGTLI